MSFSLACFEYPPETGFYIISSIMNKINVYKARLEVLKQKSNTFIIRMNFWLKSSCYFYLYRLHDNVSTFIPLGVEYSMWMQSETMRCHILEMEDHCISYLCIHQRAKKAQPFLSGQLLCVCVIGIFTIYSLFVDSADACWTLLNKLRLKSKKIKNWIISDLIKETTYFSWIFWYFESMHGPLCSSSWPGRFFFFFLCKICSFSKVI